MHDDAIPQHQEVLWIERRLGAQALWRWGLSNMDVKFVDVLSDALIQSLSSWQEIAWVKGGRHSKEVVIDWRNREAFENQLCARPVWQYGGRSSEE